MKWLNKYYVKFVLKCRKIHKCDWCNGQIKESDSYFHLTNMERESIPIVTNEKKICFFCFHDLKEDQEILEKKGREYIKLLPYSVGYGRKKQKAFSKSKED